MPSHPEPQPDSPRDTEAETELHALLRYLKALADEGQVDRVTVARAISALGVDPDKPVPWKV